MTSEAPPRNWVLADPGPLIESAARLVTGNASEKDRRCVRRYLKSDGERRLWQVGQADGKFPVAKAGVERAGSGDEALGLDVRRTLWRVLTSLGRGHFGLVVAATTGHIEFSPSDPIGVIILQMARELARIEPVQPEIRTGRCAYCLGPMTIGRRHPGGTPMRRFCSPRCRAAANYRERRKPR